MSRWRAGAIHFLISLAIFLGLLAVILLLWYPGILFNIDRGWTGLQLVIGVDLIAGPLLTLVVFKSGKKGLNFDLSCIAFFQAACMAAGMWVIYNERPIAIVLAYDTFYSVDREGFLQYERDPQVLEDFPGPYPKLIYIQLPESEIAAQIASMRAQFIGDPLYIQTENYRAMPDSVEGLRSVFRAEQTTRRGASENVLNQLDESCLFSKFISPVVSGFVCFNTDSRTLSKFYESASAAAIVEE
ncbi:MAG: hypothetical protein COB20_01140 [SAR86 cluster bacterium]|uniref:Pilus assembly protein n=1 Tax=SAR86 cluster bacterium TaxID=2030880 RepID=A0A2A4XHE0_9GAMM|nr:MAG: hypothetical protein COB20_01140 [SAR86 cluster bacterium]